MSNFAHYLPLFLPFYLSTKNDIVGILYPRLNEVIGLEQAFPNNVPGIAELEKAWTNFGDHAEELSKKYPDAAWVMMLREECNGNNLELARIAYRVYRDMMNGTPVEDARKLYEILTNNFLDNHIWDK